jgi:hypothetical protein
MHLALLDSNIVIASVAEAHEHHEASISLFLARAEGLQVRTFNGLLV